MQQLIYFIQRYKYFLFFLFLEIIAIALTFNNLSFHKSKFVSSANSVTGGMLQKNAAISDYFNLTSQNKELAKENLLLKNLLNKTSASLNILADSTVIDTLIFNQKYEYVNAKIISNNYNTPYNFITINSGKKKGVTSEMAVINSKGIIGITDHVSNGYARVQSILNKNSKINARFKNSSHFGSLTWNGKDYNTVQLTDIPRQAIIKKGDTIITDGKSTIFPEGIPVGTVKEINEKNSTINSLDILLFNDMSNISYVYVIKNLHKEEIKTLENIANE